MALNFTKICNFFDKVLYIQKKYLPLPLQIASARMAESVDALVSNTSRFTPVPVRPRLRVQKTLVEAILRGFLLFKTSKMVTFGHHFKNGGLKNGKKESKKNVEKVAF